MINSVKKTPMIPKISWRKRLILPIAFLLLSFILILLQLSDKIVSFRTLVSYIFIPQVRVANSSFQYVRGVHQTVKELLNTHLENKVLKEENRALQLLSIQNQELMAENERLKTILKLNKAIPWKGVWTKVIYRNPEQWDVFIIDKGSEEGIEPRSAVLALQEETFVLAGIVLEVDTHVSKIVFITHNEFSASVFIKNHGMEGLLVGQGRNYPLVQYLPLFASVGPDDEVYTSASSVVFPEGLLIGKVKKILKDEAQQTLYKAFIEPFANVHVGKELFVITRGGKGA